MDVELQSLKHLKTDARPTVFRRDNYLLDIECFSELDLNLL